MLMHLDFASDTPIYLQIRNQVVQGIAQGTLLPGARLPAIRALAYECGVNMMTVSKAYQLLKQEGYILTDRRHGAVVTPGPAPQGRLSAQGMDTLGLLICEAKLAGIPSEDFLALCAQMYENGGPRS